MTPEQRQDNQRAGLKQKLAELKERTHINELIVKEHAEYEAVFCDKHIEDLPKSCPCCELAESKQRIVKSEQARRAGLEDTDE